MPHAFLRFYAELGDFLPRSQRQVTFVHRFAGHPSVKDLIESIGVPHPEVDLILANGEPVDFAYSVRSRDWISVYPKFRLVDIGPLERVGPPPLREARFVLDTHLGRLASYLRVMGLDTLYRNGYADDELARISSETQRILLTRDPGLLKRRIVTYGYWVRETEPEHQLHEILTRFDLLAAVSPFRRCLRCNGLLEPVDKRKILDRLLPETREHYDEFWICPSCDQVYWRGSHYRRMEQLVRRTLAGIPIQ